MEWSNVKVFCSYSFQPFEIAFKINFLKKNISVVSLKNNKRQERRMTTQVHLLSELQTLIVVNHNQRNFSLNFATTSEDHFSAVFPNEFLI